MRIRLIVVLASAQEDNADVVMDMANFLWVPRGVAIKGEFARTIQEVFQTRVRDADFSRSEDVRQLVNRRINNMTRGHIQEILPPGKKCAPATSVVPCCSMSTVADKLTVLEKTTSN